MKQLREIDYVNLVDNAPTDLQTPFFFERMLQKTFLDPFSDPPHRHNFQEIIVVQSGHGRHAVDGLSIALVPPAISVIMKGQVHVFEQATDLTGWLIRFTDDFLPAGLVSQTWNYHATLFNQLGRKHTLRIQPGDLHVLRLVLDLLESEWTQPTLHTETALRHLLSILIIHIERFYTRALYARQPERDEYDAYQQFMTLLDSNFARHHNVQYYANALGMTPTKLSRLLGRVVGKATKQVIDERIVLEAKRYLQYTDISVTEIAFVLGYSDLFHLSKTFKRLTGIAPQAFREQRQKMT